MQKLRRAGRQPIAVSLGDKNTQAGRNPDAIA
jgi:hypothetical protein